MKYTKDQQTILDITDGKHIVHAPAGCGKTEMLTQRVIKALKEKTEPKDMICLTFTNRAAIEMTERLEQSSSLATSMLPFVGNIHKYCNLFLRKNNLLPDSSTLLDEEEYKTILNGLIKKWDKKTVIIRQDLFRYLCDKKREQLGLKSIYTNKYSEGFEKHISIYSTIYVHYENVKREFNFYDFDDLLNLSSHFLNTTAQYEFNNFGWIQIDEVQDLNEAQWEIINHINKSAKVEVYYGDYQQSIFSFLGSSYQSFVKWYNQVPNKHSLAKNYRSTDDVIIILNQYLKETLNSKTIFDSEQANIFSPNSFRIKPVEGTVEDEMNYITKQIKTEKYKGESLAVLVRTNKNAELCSNYLNEIGINHLKVSGVDFFQRKELKDLFAIINGWVNHFDILAWTRIFSRFTKKLSLDEARRFVYSCYKNALLPIDLLSNSTYIQNYEAALSSNRCIVFDTETTGLSPLEDDIIQIAATEIINGKVGNSFNCYLQTTKNIAETFDIHKISEKTLQKEGLRQKEGLLKFMDFIGKDSVLIAHNLDFDLNMLTAALTKYTEKDLSLLNLNYFDSLKISKLLHPKLKSYKLENLLTSFNLEGENTHNAIDDVFATVNLVLKMKLYCKEKIASQTEYISNNNKIIQTFRENFRPLEDLITDYFNRNSKVSSLIEVLYKNLKRNLVLDKYKSKIFIEIISQEESSYTNMSTEQRFKYLAPFVTNLKEVDLVNAASEIVISTPHKAKGLGFDHVIICECNTGVYPGYFSKTPEQILEDKRVLYVALSRAKKSILITHHTKVQTAYGNEYLREKSEFLNSIEHLFISER